MGVSIRLNSTKLFTLCEFKEKSMLRNIAVPRGQTINSAVNNISFLKKHTVPFNIIKSNGSVPPVYNAVYLQINLPATFFESCFPSKLLLKFSGEKLQQ